MFGLRHFGMDVAKDLEPDLQGLLKILHHLLVLVLALAAVNTSQANVRLATSQ